MTKATVASPKPAPASASAKASPKKTMSSPAARKNATTPTRNAHRAPQLTVRSFPPPFKFEMYIYEVSDTRDGFTNPIRRFVNQEMSEEPPALKKANVTKVLPRRKPFSDNDIMRDDKDYTRHVILRYNQETILPTAETRATGLRLISDFLKDGKYQSFPKSHIHCLDATNEDDYDPLDMFFLDSDIEDLMRQDIEHDELTSAFTKNHKDFAKKCWAGNHFSAFASSLGYS